MTKLTTVDELKAFIAPIAVYEDYLKLSQRGKRRLALCPFHKEKTPSFSVDGDSGLFYCFGCHKGGDVIKFVEEIEGCTFEEAVSLLARKAGVEFARSGHEKGSEEGLKRERLSKLLACASDFYRESLRSAPEGSAVKKYMEKRGISESSAKELLLGFAGEKGGLMSRLLKSEFKKEEAVDAGLFKLGSRGEYYEYFRERLMFPIFDISGRIIGFGGRTIGSDEPKYLNTPETVLFRKREILYGLNFSRDSIRKEDCSVLVEGYMDFLSLYSRGIKNVAASLGTALTSAQSALLKRYSNKVVLLYDSDNAGKAAMERALPILLAQGLEVNIAVLENAKDPDECICRVGEAKFRELLAGADSFFDHILKQVKSRSFLNVEERIKFLDYAAPSISAIPNPIQREAYVSELSERIHLKKSLIVEKIEKSAGGAVQNELIDSNGETLSISEHILIKAALAGDINFTRALLEISPKVLDSLTCGPLLKEILDGKEIQSDRELKLQAFVKNSCHEIQNIQDLQGAIYSLEKEMLEKSRKEITLKLRESQEKGEEELVEIYTRELLAIVNEAKNIQNSKFGAVKGD
jgi:DNA primase